MDPTELKAKMMKLWKSIFHDSDDYVSLVFDTYFNPELVEYHEEGGKLISALMAVPYWFGNGNEKLKGLYLCGLSTLEEYRHLGYMNRLMERIYKKAAKDGYSFTFLIPASDALRIYYSGKGFVNGMYVIEDRYTSVHDFDHDYRNILNKEDERIKKIKEKYFGNLSINILDLEDKVVVEKLKEYIIKSENNSSTYFTLLHNEKDIETIIKENHISNDEIFYASTDDGKITGCAFVAMDGKEGVKVKKIFHTDKCSYFKLLDAIKKAHPDDGMGVVCYPEETERRALWSQVYGAANPDGGMLGGAYGIAERVYEVNRHARPYGMVRIIDFREILKFLANDRRDCKFSILVKGGSEHGKDLFCSVKNGEATFKEINEGETQNISSDRNVTELSAHDFSEILLRKKDSSNIIMEALNIPRLVLNMSLLLD